MSEEKLYDLAFLNKVSGGDPEFIKEMVTTFKEIGPEYISKANELLASNAMDSLGKETHKLIPGVSFLGAKSLEYKLMLVEEYTKKGTSLEEIPGLVSECGEMIRKLIDIFEKDFGLEQ